MSSGAIAAWQANVTRDLLEQARQSIDRRHRVDIAYMELVGQYLAVKQRSRGFCNESHQQIYKGMHEVLTMETISRALRCLDYPGLWQIVKPGGKGSPTRRVLTSFDPQGLIQSCGATAPPDSNPSHGAVELSHGDSTPIARGLDSERAGLLPHTPKGSPKQLPKYSPNYPSACNEQPN
jgi:hypothetical protein